MFLIGAVQKFCAENGQGSILVGDIHQLVGVEAASEGNAHTQPVLMVFPVLGDVNAPGAVGGKDLSAIGQVALRRAAFDCQESGIVFVDKFKVRASWGSISGKIRIYLHHIPVIGFSHSVQEGLIAVSHMDHEGRLAAFPGFTRAKCPENGGTVGALITGARPGQPLSHVAAGNVSYSEIGKGDRCRSALGIGTLPNIERVDKEAEGVGIPVVIRNCAQVQQFGPIHIRGHVLAREDIPGQNDDILIGHFGNVDGRRIDLGGIGGIGVRCALSSGELGRDIR